MSVEKLVQDVSSLIKSSVKDIVDQRVIEFKRLGNSDAKELFKELCFCILTANFQAERSIKIQREIADGFIIFSEDKLRNVLKQLGHRYPNTRARYIVEARTYLPMLPRLLSIGDSNVIREWLVRNIRGIGYKEASHFLRNVGFLDVAIIDYHILDVLSRYGVIDKPKNLNKTNYLKIEETLREIAYRIGISLGELDLYLWYLETGKVLK